MHNGRATLQVNPGRMPHVFFAAFLFACSPLLSQGGDEETPLSIPPKLKIEAANRLTDEGRERIGKLLQSRASAVGRWLQKRIDTARVSLHDETTDVEESPPSLFYLPELRFYERAVYIYASLEEGEPDVVEVGESSWEKREEE